MIRGEAVRAGATLTVPHNGKSAAAFRTTGEVAEALDLPAHVLRFWESKFPQIKPLKRGGGRRYYRPQDVDLLRRIRQCLYQQGYTIRGVQKLLHDGALPADDRAPRSAADQNLSGPFAADPVVDAPQPTDRSALSRQASREALEEARRELLEIRAALDRLVRS